MRINGCISSRPGQILVFPVRDVLSGAIVPVLLGQSEVDQKQFVAVSTDAHQEVVGLDVPMDEVLVVDVFDASDHLVSQHQHRLHGESSGAEVEEVFQRGTKKVHHQHVVVAFGAVPSEKKIQ